MRIFICCLVLTASLCRAKDTSKNAQEKRRVSGVATATQKPAYSSSAELPQEYSKLSPQTFGSAKSGDDTSSGQQQYIRYITVPAEQAYSTAPQQFDYDQSKKLSYLQSDGIKLQNSLSAAKVAYPQTPSQPLHYSQASDVSSFSYSSPLVKYNSLGLLSLNTGKTSTPVTQPSQQVSYAAVPQQKLTNAQKYTYTPTPSQQTYTQQQPQVQYVTQKVTQNAETPQFSYADGAPKVQYVSPKATYTAGVSGVAPQNYAQGIPQNYQQLQSYLQAVPQYVSAAPQAASYSGIQQNQVYYTSSPQVAYVQQPQAVHQPQYLPQQSQANAPQGAQSAPQYVYALAPPQTAYNVYSRQYLG